MELNIQEVLDAYKAVVSEQSEQIILLKATVATLNKKIEELEKSKVDSDKSE